MAERCPTCGKPMRKAGRRLLLGAVIGTMAGILLAYLLVIYYFGGVSCSNPMALIHYIAGAILGSLVGTAAAFLIRR